MDLSQIKKEEPRFEFPVGLLYGFIRSFVNGSGQIMIAGRSFRIKDTNMLVWINGNSCTRFPLEGEAALAKINAEGRICYFIPVYYMDKYVEVEERIKKELKKGRSDCMPGGGLRRYRRLAA